jgi:N-glycosylase/DNA lyase
MRLKYFRAKRGKHVMSTDKEKIEQLIGRIDETLSVLKTVAEDLKTVSASLKSLAVSQITSKPAPAQVPAPKPAAASVPKVIVSVTSEAPKSASSSLEDTRMMFPPDLDSLLIFEEKDDYIVIKPKQFLGSENFAKIASTVRGIGGEYISAGRDSHFRVYKKKT